MAFKAQQATGCAGSKVWRHGMEIAGVEPVRISSLREQLLRLHRIVWVEIYRQRKWHAFTHDVAVDLGGAERVGVAERLSVKREARRLAHALIGPGRLRVPHIEEVEEKGGDAAGEGE